MAPRRTPPAGRPLALLYVRVSTEEQATFGASLAAQVSALLEEADRRGFDAEVIRDEGLSAKSLRRPGLIGALDRLDRGEAAVLMAWRLDRLSRSVADFASVLDRARRRHWRLVVCDVDVDTATPSGEFLVNIMASSAQFERRLIGQRTREGMAQKRSEGVHVGRRTELPLDVVSRMVSDRRDGMSLRAIATALNEEHTPTAHGGGKWHASTVSGVLKSAAARRLTDPSPVSTI
jgi:DNA invertase Pin-like site-specific DNA recombinase